MNCSFQQTRTDEGKELYRCRACGFEIWTAAGKAPKRNCEDAHLECRYRGEEIRKEKDQTCGCPNKYASIYECQIHGECSKRKYLTHDQTIVDCLHCKIEDRGFRESTFPRETQEPIDLVAVTSLAPNEKAIDAVQSWRDAGLRIVAVQPRDEMEKIKAIYANLVDDWIAVDQDGRNIFGKPYVFIWQMADLAVDWDRPIMLINSDIEIHGDNQILTDFARNSVDTLTIGVRHNYEDWRAPKLEQFGLDVFIFGPSFANTLPKLSLCMGVPWWDYWMPKHAQREGVAVDIYEEPIFFHRKHALNWTKEHWIKAGIMVLRAGYDFGFTDDSDVVHTNHLATKFRDSLRTKRARISA